MPETITLRVSFGDLLGQTFSFSEKTSLIIGRQEDCAIVLPDRNISRHHCILDINPPLVSVWDNGSTNGTYLNDVCIGNEESKACNKTPVVYPVRAGDRLGIGECELTLEVTQSGANVPQSLESFERMELLGTGTASQVWRVRDEASGMQFALKQVHLPGQPDEVERALFLREANLVAQLDHPNIVRHYKSGENEDGYYLLQGLCEGGSIRDWMIQREGQPLPVETATHIILQVLTALDYAHHAPMYKEAGGEWAMGIVHRDVKPGNILLLDRGDAPTAMLGDFGLAKIFEFSGLTERLLREVADGWRFSGTLYYTPKVQIHDYKNAKPEVDVWAAAATYYLMLTGWPPKNLEFADRTKLAIVLDAIPIRQRNGQIPSRLADVIDDALRENPLRPADTNEEVRRDEPQLGCLSAAELKKRIEAAL